MAERTNAKPKKKQGQCVAVGCTRKATSADGFCRSCDLADRAALYEEDETEGRRSPLGQLFSTYWRREGD